MKRILDYTIILAVMFCLATASGCQQQLDPGADPVVVNAEKSIEISFEGVKAFLDFDGANRDFMRASLPDVHALAERIRPESKTVFREARAALASYKATRTPGDASTLDVKLNIVQSLAREARNALIRAQQSKGAQPTWQRSSPPLPLLRA
jgi:hypothetical protein